MHDTRPSSDPDPGRYPWRFDVTDAHDRDRVLGITAEYGEPRMTGPPWWKTDPDTGERILAAWQAACELGRRQQAQIRRP